MGKTWSSETSSNATETSESENILSELRIENEKRRQSILLQKEIELEAAAQARIREENAQKRLTANPLYWKYLNERWGLTAPYEHVGIYLSVGGFLIKGVPSFYRSFLAWRITGSTDITLRKTAAQQLFINFHDLPPPTDRVAVKRFLAPYTRSAGHWACVPVAVCWYLLRASETEVRYRPRRSIDTTIN